MSDIFGFSEFLLSFASKFFINGFFADFGQLN